MNNYFRFLFSSLYGSVLSRGCNKNVLLTQWVEFNENEWRLVAGLVDVRVVVGRDALSGEVLNVGSKIFIISRIFSFAREPDVLVKQRNSVRCHVLNVKKRLQKTNDFRYLTGSSALVSLTIVFFKEVGISVGRSSLSLLVNGSGVQL